MEKEYILRDKKSSRINIGNFEDNPAISIPNSDPRISTWDVAPADMNPYTELPTPESNVQSVQFQNGSIPREKAPRLPVRNAVRGSKRNTTVKRVNVENSFNPGLINENIEDSWIVPNDYGHEEVYSMMRSVNDANASYMQPVGVTPSRNVEPIPEYIEQDITSDLHRRVGEPRKQQQILIKVAFLKLGEIRTLHEDFTADIFLQAKWRERKLDKRSWVKDYELVQSHKYWNPEISIENSIGDLRQNIWHVVTHEKNGNAYICEKRRVKGTFSERMELSDYPFDTQNFTIQVVSNRRESEVKLNRDPGNMDDLAIQTFVDQQEWTLHQNTEVSNQVATFTNKNQTFKRPTINITIKATRKASYFVWNIILFMIFICSLIFATFAVEYTLVQNRLQLAFILMLSNITFKRVVSDTLPKVSYLTYLDHYVIWQTTVMFLVAVWHAVVFQIPNKDHALLADKIALGVCGAIYLISQIIFFCRWGVTVYRQKKYTFLNTFIN